MDMCLHKFEIYQGTVAPKSFKSHTNSWCPDIAPLPPTLKKKKKILVNLMPGWKFNLSEVASFQSDNLSVLKKVIFGHAVYETYFLKGKLFLRINALEVH